jgi:hypothetical protein
MIFKRIAFVILLCLFGLGVYLRHFRPEPSTGLITAVVVENSSARTPAIGAVLTDPDLLAYVAQKKIAWHVVDQAETGPDLAEVQIAITAATNCPLPALVICAGAGKPKVCALPASASACLAILKRYAG